MKLTINNVERKDELEYRFFYELILDGKSYSFHDGEPEDNSLTRNFRYVYSIPDMIRKAYEAGKNGEELEIEEVSRDPWKE